MSDAIHPDRVGTRWEHSSARRVSGTSRVAARASSLLDQVEPGDVVVVDHTDLDPRTARALAEVGIAALVTTGPLVSSRFPSSGPEVLAHAGVVLVRDAGPDALTQVPDGQPVELLDGSVLVGGQEVAQGVVVDPADLQLEMRRARTSLVAHLDTFTANAVDFVRREQPLVLEGEGLPRLRTTMTGRPVLVVARAEDQEAELDAVRSFARARDVAVVAVGRAADDLRAAGIRPDVLVLSTDDPAAVPTLEGLRAARDVVVRVGRGDHPRMLQSLAALGADPLTCETTARAEDVALLLAAAGDPETVVGVGVHADLHELLDHRRGALASTYVTRLRLGHLLVDASAVPRLHGGGPRTWHAVVVLLLGALALLAALAATPVGQDWAQAVLDAFGAGS